MTTSWTYPEPAFELLIVEDTIVITTAQACTALDGQGRERWRRELDCQPAALTRCGNGVTLKLSRPTSTEVVAFDLEGKERWRYHRNWRIHGPGITGDRRGIVMYGADENPAADRWVGLDAVTGVPVFDIPPPTNASPEIAGACLIAAIDDDSDRGLMRTDRDGRNPVVLTAIPYISSGLSDELALLTDSVRNEVIAIELRSGRELWRAPGGHANLYLEVHGNRAAWVEDWPTARPVVYDLATGARIWIGDPLPPSGDHLSYQCKLGQDALVCYCGDERVIYYSLQASSPVHSRAWSGDRPGVSCFCGKRFVQQRANRLTCGDPFVQDPISESRDRHSPRRAATVTEPDPRSMTKNDGYVAAVADGLAFALGDAWVRLAAHDPLVSLERVRTTLRELAQLGVDPSFGDGELPVIPAAGEPAIAVLREQLQRIRAIAPQVLAGGADTGLRILCTDPWPRIYTTSVLDEPATSPVHVIQASDLTGRLDQWDRMGQLAQFRELRLLIAFGSPLGRTPWPLDLAAFPELRALDLRVSGLRALPPSITSARELEFLELGRNPLDVAALAPLAALPKLRYVGLRTTAVRAKDLSRLALPAGCDVALDDEAM